MNLGCTTKIGMSIAAALLVLGLAAFPAAAFRIEAESYTAAYNIAPDDIFVSAGVLYGLDYPAEWTRYELAPTAPGAYAVTLLCWGALYTPYRLQVVLESPPAATQTIDLQFTGHGTCGG